MTALAIFSTSTDVDPSLPVPAEIGALYMNLAFLEDCLIPLMNASSIQS